jgi:hypothetical protein
LTSSVYSTIAFYLFCFEHTHIDKPNNQPEHIKKEKPCSINLDELDISCDDFNESVYYGEDADVIIIGRKLKLCKNNGSKKGRQKKNKNKKNKNN